MAAAELLVERRMEASPARATAAPVDVCEELVEMFAAVVGSHGVLALLERSLRLLESERAWLGPAIGAEAPFESLRTCLGEQETRTALEAGVVLIATLVGLLATFIGEGLVRQLIEEAWPGVLTRHTVGEENQ
jgi:hypothetical protein